MWTVGGTAVGASDGRSSTRRPSWARVRDLVVVALGVVGAGSLLVGEGPLADLGVWTWLEAWGR